MVRLSALASTGMSTAALLLATGGGALAQAPQAQGTTGLTMEQIVVQTGPESAARGAPNTLGTPQSVGPRLDGRFPGTYAARDGAVPEGIEPLDRTIYSSDDFYADRDLWMDPRYYNCASPAAIEGIWGAYEISSVGDNPPATIAWGYCDRDVDREAIISPYPFGTAQEHYDALLAEAQSRGGPTQYSRENPPPDWSGVYAPAGFQQGFGSGWIDAGSIQVPTYLSLLTPEYQQRFVQQEYHFGHDNSSLWPGSYCWPEGFMRRFVTGFDRWLQVSPDLVSLWTDASETLMTYVNIGREFNVEGSVPRLGEDIRRWYGETIGFWDGDILITWTSNIRGWLAHGWFENSDQMQSIEIYTPITDMDGNFAGINREAILYDPEALAEPVRIIENWEWSRGLSEGNPFDFRICVSDLYPLNGIQTRVQPGDTIEYTVPYLYGRPWADIWEEYFEQDMQRPEEEDVLSNF